MKFWRKIGIGALLLGVLAGLWGCDVAKIKDLSVTSVGVKYLVVRGRPRKTPAH